MKVVVRAAPGENENIAERFVDDIEKERAGAVAKIEELIKGNKVNGHLSPYHCRCSIPNSNVSSNPYNYTQVVLFMKGTKLFPMCGFSNTAVQVLRALDAQFETFDVLSGEWWLV